MIAGFRNVIRCAVALTPMFCLAASGAEPTTQPTAPSTTQPTTQPTTQASAEPTTKPTPEIIALVDKLSDESYPVREAAMKELAAMGEDAEPSLKILAQTDLPSEAKARVAAALVKIDENRQTGPSVITMHCTEAPLGDVLNEFARQARADLGVHRPQIVQFAKDKTISVDLNHANFWDALRAITTKTGLSLQPYGNDQRMTLQLTGGGGLDISGAQCTVAGPFLLIPQNSTLTSTVNYAKNPGAGARNLNLLVSVMAEPKIHVIGGINSDWISQAVDEKGHSLLSGGRQPYYFNNNGRQWWWQLQTTLKIPAEIGEKIARLKGELKVVMQTKSKSIEFDDLSKGNVTKTVAGLTVTFKQMTTPQPNLAQIVLSVVAPPSGSGQALQDFINGVDVRDKNDQMVQRGGMGQSASPGHMELTLSYYFAGDQRPAKLSWEIPTETRQVTVPFEVDDLLLPTAVPAKRP